MNKLEAHLQDKQWIAFRDIPPCVRRQDNPAKSLAARVMAEEKGGSQ